MPSKNAYSIMRASSSSRSLAIPAWFNHSLNHKRLPDDPYSCLNRWVLKIRCLSSLFWAEFVLKMREKDMKCFIEKTIDLTKIWLIHGWYINLIIKTISLYYYPIDPGWFSRWLRLSYHLGNRDTEREISPVEDHRRRARRIGRDFRWKTRSTFPTRSGH